MKIFVLSADFTPNSPAWMNIFWPHYNAIAESAPTVHLCTPQNIVGKGPLPKLDLKRQNRAYGRQLREQVLSELDPNGPNILLVWALRSRDIDRAALLEPIWDKFSHHVLAVVDNLKPDHVHNHVQGRYDKITCFCGDLAGDFEKMTGTETLYSPPHTDTLTFHNATPYRPIDLLIVGRRNPDVYYPMHRHFNMAGRNRFSLDFVSRTRNTRYTSEEEFRLLATTYAKAKTAFCFEPSKQPRFHSRSPLTERWVHAWTSGCTVIGTTPTGKGVAEASDWKDAMVDLPEDPNDAIEAAEAILSDEAGLAERRVRNVAEALRRHDTRHRLSRLLDALDLPRPDALTVGLENLKMQADTIEAGP